MRVTQVALLRGKILPHDVPGLKQQLAEEFPASDSLMNRELSRLLCYLQASSAMDRYLAYLKSDASDVDRLHLALHLRYLKEGWTPQSRMAVLQFYEEAQLRRGGSGYPRYILNVTKDFVAGMGAQAARAVLMRGDEFPNAALGALYHLPPEVDEELLQALRKVDQKLAANRQDDAAQRLQVGIVAILARAGDADSMAYLRTAWNAIRSVARPWRWGWPSNPTATIGRTWFAACRCWRATPRASCSIACSPSAKRPKTATSIAMSSCSVSA